MTVKAASPRSAEDCVNQKRAKLSDGRTEDGIEYCPYTVTSQNYDTRRVNPGINIVLGGMCLSDVPLSEQKVLDVGCGTGSFIEQIYRKVKSVEGVEYNDGMLGKAQEKFKGNSKVHVRQGAAQQLPFPDQTFHAVTVNQVIHHFSNSNNFEEFKQCLMEAHRVLIPGGVFILNTSTPEQQRDAFWWLELFPKQSVRQCARFPSLQIMKEHMKTVGFVVSADSVTVPTERPLMHHDLYLNDGCNLAFQKAYRDCDSSWEMPPEELEEGLAQLRSMQKDGSATQWLQNKEAQRMSMGQATFLTVHKI